MGISYQQALERIRSLGAAPAELARRTGWPLKECDAYLLAPTKRPAIDMRTRGKHASALGRVCEDLRAATLARAVCVVDRAGNWLAMSGLAAMRFLALPRHVRIGNREPESLALDPKGTHVLSCALETGGRLFVLFELERSVGLVRLRARAAVREINRILSDPPVFQPPGGGESGSGAPAQISAFDGIFDRRGKVGSA
jgi:hypothetical protein